MRRRDLLKAAGAAALTVGGAPRLARADRAKTLVFVGVAGLSVLDPVFSGNRPTRNYAYLVFCCHAATLILGSEERPLPLHEDIALPVGLPAAA